MLHVSMMRQISSFVYDANPGGSPGRDGAVVVVVVGLEQAYYEVGMVKCMCVTKKLTFCIQGILMIYM